MLKLGSVEIFVFFAFVLLINTVVSDENEITLCFYFKYSVDWSKSNYFLSEWRRKSFSLNLQVCSKLTEICQGSGRDEVMSESNKNLKRPECTASRKAVSVKLPL